MRLICGNIIKHVEFYFIMNLKMDYVSQRTSEFLDIQDWLNKTWNINMTTSGKSWFYNDIIFPSKETYFLFLLNYS